MNKITVFACALVLMSTIFAACASEADKQADPTAETTDTVAVPNFGPINKLSLNDASEEDFALIPGVGRRMVREFVEYRPYISIDQFRREMAKYVDAEEITGYEKYLYVPVNYNESDLATLEQIPGVNAEMAQQFVDARPYESRQAFLAKVLEVSGGISGQFARYYIIQE
jgi:DNA uptake protein ComE-like DNA-binding protein